MSCTFFDLACGGQAHKVHETTTFLQLTFLNSVTENLTTPEICSYTTLQAMVNRLFSDINVSQGSVATYCKFTGESGSERILKIGQDLTKISP